jgi:LmbE family N-acetylglucosaminyl deacetylase
VTIRRADPEELFPGTLLLLVPHVDDCVLGCGGTLARLSRPDRIHVAYATDGAGSPEPVLPWRDHRDVAALVRDRLEEGRRAMGSLGIPRDQVHFFALPDGRLRRHGNELEDRIRTLVAAIRPDHVLAPFRYDRHPDHLALNRAATEICRGGDLPLTEYFVYHRSRLLPRGDVREYIRPELLREVDVAPVADRKARALRMFTSQTTRYYDWQTRPNLTPELIDQVSGEPEVFLPYDPARPGPAVLVRGASWIRVPNRLEPVLKRAKDRTVAVLRRLLGGPWKGSLPTE